MLTLPRNYANIIGRLVMLFLLLLIIIMIATFGLKDPYNENILFTIEPIHFIFKAAYLLYLFTALISFLMIKVLSTLLSINKILIDTNDDSITFFKPFSKKTIKANEINEYYQTTHRNNLKTWQGLIMKTNDNIEIQVAGQNIKSLIILKDYLDNKKILSSGNKKMKFPFN
ncbi:MAG: hypothetical protein EKK37_13600 [Sphingobacteriales bacterium]|nr:MAG: hypothetical protein EKK37_13600 [Sphingobacteriales bacterium]